MIRVRHRNSGGSLDLISAIFIQHKGTGYIQVDPGNIAYKLTEKPGGLIAPPHLPPVVFEVCQIASIQVLIFRVHRHLPHAFA